MKGEGVESFVYLDNARVQEQLEVMERIKAEGVCPFCPEHLSKFHLQPILWRGRHWVLTYNQWPYEGTRLHLLLICRYHAEKWSDLIAGAGEELRDAMQWAETEFEIESGGVGIRFGKAGPNGATVNHLHVHLIVGDGTNKVKFKVAQPST